MRRAVVGMTRHAGTEDWASHSAVFSSIERAAAARFETRPFPHYIHGLPWSRAALAFAELLPGCDALVCCGEAPSTPDSMLPFIAREQLSLDTAMLFMALGGLPRGARGYRAVHRYLRPQDAILFSSTADLAIFRNLVAYTPARLALTPFGIDTRAFAPLAPDQRRRVRTHLGYAEGDLVLISVGRVTAEKNVHGLVTAFASLHRLYPRTRLLVVGPVDDRGFDEFETAGTDVRKAINRIAVQLGCARNVQWLGHQPPAAIPQLLGASDVFVNLSLHHDENFGYSNVEAMCSGLPVVATGWGGAQDTVVDGEVGFVVPTLFAGNGVRADLPAAIASLSALVEDAGLRRRMGRAGRVRVSRMFPLERFQAAVRREIDLALRRRRRPRRAATPRYTSLGRAIAERFVVRESPIPGGAPRWISFSGDRTLYRRVIRPYGAVNQDARLRDNTLLYLASPSVEVGARAVVVDDLLWPVRVSRVAPVHRALLRSLLGSGVGYFGELVSRLPHFRRRDLRAATCELMEAGVLVASTLRDEPGA